LTVCAVERVGGAGRDVYRRCHRLWGKHWKNQSQQDKKTDDECTHGDSLIFVRYCCFLVAAIAAKAAVLVGAGLPAIGSTPIGAKAPPTKTICPYYLFVFLLSVNYYHFICDLLPNLVRVILKSAPSQHPVNRGSGALHFFPAQQA
jgi:hypothetical protein